MKKLAGLLTASVTILVVVYALYMGQNSSNPSSSHSDKSTLKSSTTSANTADINSLPTVVKNTEDSSKALDVKGKKSDYKPMDGTGNLVSDSQSQPMEQTQTLGQNVATTKDEVGSQESKVVNADLFPEDMYPYRAMLKSAQQGVYDQVYHNAISQNTTFSVSNSLTQDAVNEVMTAIYNDHPELFYLDTSYSYGYTDKGAVVSITLKYNDTVNSLQISENNFLNSSKGIIIGASNLTTDLEKEKYVYTAIMQMCSYHEDSVLNQSAYSALVNGKSVCAGYSRAFQYIMMQLDIPCYFCSGYANGGNHAWNIIEIDGSYYNVDISWDDSMGELSNNTSYTYFNISDSTIALDHTRRDLSLNLPKCR